MILHTGGKVTNIGKGNVKNCHIPWPTFLLGTMLTLEPLPGSAEGTMKPFGRAFRPELRVEDSRRGPITPDVTPISSANFPQITALPMNWVNSEFFILTNLYNLN
jgi:hypothetical protein